MYMDTPTNEIQERHRQQRYDQWIKLLKSGRYVQGSGKLRKRVKIEDGVEQDEFCCLGVLCDMVEDGAWMEREVLPIDGVTVYGHVGEATEMPDQHIMDAVGIDRELAILLAEMNDYEGATFEEIAEKLEEQRELVFDNG